jgi:two-component system nitrate/nitrite response regulator NarL
MSAVTRIVLVDDHALCRSALADLLERRGGMQVIGRTGDPDEAIRLARDEKPDLMVMDLRMPQSDGLVILARLRDLAVTTPVIILTVSDAEEDIWAALRAGARGYLLKDMELDDVVEGIERAARGELVVAPAMTLKLAHMLQSGQRDSARADPFATLTEREREILQHLSRGETNKAIARVLDISHDTVKLHVRHILSKLNLTSRVEAAVFAIEHRATAPAAKRGPGA